MINGLTPVELSSKCKHKLWIKLHGREISEYLVNNIRPTLRRKPDIIAMHIGTNNIKNDNCSTIQIYLNKTHDLVIELSPSMKIALSLRHGKNNIDVKINRRNEIIKQFRKTSPIEIIRIDETKYAQVSQTHKFIFLITSSHLFGGTKINQEEEK